MHLCFNNFLKVSKLCNWFNSFIYKKVFNDFPAILSAYFFLMHFVFIALKLSKSNNKFFDNILER